MTLQDKFQRFALRLRLDTRGQDLVEYALMAGFVAVAAGAILPTILFPSLKVIYDGIKFVLERAAAIG